MKRGKALTLAAALLTTLVVASTADSLSSGIGRTTSPALPPEGCNCHGTDGQPNDDVQISWRVSPSATFYEANKVYNLSFGGTSDVEVASDGNKGGFNLRVTVGKLAAGPGYADLVQSIGNDQEFGHTLKGDKEEGRNWNLTWTAPGDNEAPAIFTLWVNHADGSGDPNAGDHFAGAVYVIPHKAGAAIGGAEERVNPEHVGVSWLAHWVGIISVLAVVGTLLLYYFVLKYGESIHTTDHRDRKEK